MNKFKVGEKVRIKEGEKFPSRVREKDKNAIGKICTITSILGSYSYHTNYHADTHFGGFWEDELQKIGGSMSKYEDLKQRIEVLNDGWNKEADDILQEIGSTSLFIEIRTKNGGDDTFGDNTIEIYRGPKTHLVSFNAKNQCEKLEAFKKALLWLLDNSNIKKVDEKTTKIKELEQKLYDLRASGDEIAEEIRLLKEGK